MLKWLVILAAGYFLFRMFTNDSRHKKQEVQKQKEEKIATGELVKDPTCGTYIDADAGITVRNGDIIHRFCSYECRDAYVKKVQNEQKKVADASAATDEEKPEVSSSSESKRVVEATIED